MVPWNWATFFLRVIPTPCSSVRKVSCADLAGRLDTNKVLFSLAFSKRERLSIVLEGPEGTLVLFLATSHVAAAMEKYSSLFGRGTSVPGRGWKVVNECECIKCSVLRAAGGFFFRVLL